jgi:hypothetical protein
MIKTIGLKGNELRDRLKQLSQPMNEVVSMVEPSKYHNRLSPTNHLKKTFGSKPNEEEEVEIDLDEILREMGYEDEVDDEELSDKEFRDVLIQLDVEDLLDEKFTVKPQSKGYREGMKLVSDLRRGLFRKLDNDELDDFMGVLKTSFGFD